MDLSISDTIIIVNYYLHKMQEGGLASANDTGIGLTEKGFDAAFDLIHAGAKVPQHIMRHYLAALELCPPSELDAFSIMFTIQEKGFENFMKELSK